MTLEVLLKTILFFFSSEMKYNGDDKISASYYVSDLVKLNSP